MLLRNLYVKYDALQEPYRFLWFFIPFCIIVLLIPIPINLLVLIAVAIDRAMYVTYG